MTCDKIMLIRHSERPSADKKFRGVNLEGRKDKESLSVRGWQRAGALVRFFAPRDNHFVHPALARPQTLYACKAAPEDPSLRPQNSLLPLAELLNAESKVEFNRDYFEGEEAALVQKALAAPGPALIAWKHLTMHVIANAILGDDTTAPQYWPFERVDLVWVFDRRGGAWTFTQVPQLLLAGDRADVVE
ncbi:histidine phosphatase family protein [Methylocapsa polymorpha]|uniref:Histidine phosphatase family protein n=1 Tax=Methylocapsa polymorpha TaxID=3080828 RepID=A0ABZ0HPM6_9HYPH|nr:histidine phosphatase family protein [Methylocapsa sp. RX1]